MSKLSLLVASAIGIAMTSNTILVTAQQPNVFALPIVSLPTPPQSRPQQPPQLAPITQPATISSPFPTTLPGTLPGTSPTPIPAILPAPVVNQDQLKQCNAKNEFYYPFFLNNPDAAIKATTPLNSNDGIEANINVGSILTRDCFDCNEIHQFINIEKSNIINNNMKCSNHSDCTVTFANTILRGGCQSITNHQGAKELTQWVKKWDDWFGNGTDQRGDAINIDVTNPNNILLSPIKTTDTHTNQVQLHHSVCGYAAPRCMMLEAECFQGKCEMKQDRVLVDPIPDDVINNNNNNNLIDPNNNNNLIDPKNNHNNNNNNLIDPNNNHITTHPADHILSDPIPSNLIKPAVLNGETIKFVYPVDVDVVGGVPVVNH